MAELGKSVLKGEGITKVFGYGKTRTVAVDHVDFDFREGEVISIVGESGSGKTTIARMILGLIGITDGKLMFNGQPRDISSGKKKREYWKNIQAVFQDPFSSLNPRMAIGEIIGEPFQIYKTCKSKEEINKRVSELMDIVGLAQRLRHTYPHELDGGRRQRVGVARALALNPKFIVCDEPVSALDVSIQAQILNLMQDLQRELGLTYIFITHDLSVVKHISDEICVMYLGEIVEQAPAKELFRNPTHPYTQALLSAIPRPKVPRSTSRIILKGELSSPIEPKPGCRFAPRCIYAKDICFTENPPKVQLNDHHFACCHCAGCAHK